MGFAALKLDMEKAFDKVEWPFVLAIFKHFGFSDKWINLINECISIPTFSIFINGSLEGHFKSHRGFRQGGSISPFLFIMVIDVLSRPILQKEVEGLLNGIKIARNCSTISHLMFADDLVVFSHASHSDLEAIQDCLNQFHDWSGLSINHQKSTISFSSNVPQSSRNAFCNHIGLKPSDPQAFYLRLPLYIKCGQVSSFSTIIEKINNRVYGWKAKVLSQAGQAMLIKLVFSSIPTYWMSSFQLPKFKCHRIDAKLRDFFWGFLDSKHHLYPKAWNSLCMPKFIGGLSFRRAFDLNKALISKLGWSICMKSNKPWVKLLRAKYLRGRNLLTATAKSNASSIWKGIINSIPLLRKGFCFHINSSSSVNIWHDLWIPSLQGFIPSTPLVPPAQHLVAELLILGTHIWNKDLLLCLFDLPTVNHSQQIHLIASLAEDTAFWACNPSGDFTIKSALLTD